VANALFYILSVGAILAAAGVIASRNPVMSVLSLLGSFFCIAVIYLLAGFQFLAAIQILVYAGAIMVLFLFVVMLLNLGDPEGEAALEPMFHHGRRAFLAMGTSVAILVAGGLTNEEIARKSQRRTRTISTHLSNIYTKLEIGGAGARVRLGNLVREAGLLE